MPRIDAHQHFWQYNSAQYGWIGDDMNVIRRDFLPEDLASEMKLAGVDGSIAVQAAGAGETEWLLGLAKDWDFILGVVGWVPLTDPLVGDEISRLAHNPKLRGLRHVVQDEPDPNYILRDDFNAGIRKVTEAGLVYDILIFERHLSPAIQFVDKHPNQVFVLDHIAKPRIKDGLITPWRQKVRELAKRPNVYCKISGIVTEAEWGKWTPEQLLPYIETVIEAFGANRLMFGSDWPVCLLATSYKHWVELVENALTSLSVSERQRIWGGTAREAYSLQG
jgi:L-fuconolactonase